MEARNLVIDNGFCTLGFFAAIGYVRGNRVLEVVNIVDENSVQLVHLGINIARNRDIDEKHGTVLTAAEEHFTVLAAKDGVRRTGRGDDNVATITGVVKAAEFDRLAIEFLRQPYGAVVGTVGYKDRWR